MNNKPKNHGAEFWDQRYGEDSYFYGSEPNEWFRQELDKLPVGKILLPAEGEGRNALYAAQRGWVVHAFDYSREGRKKALALASRHQVKINYQICRAEDFECMPASFDLVAMIYTHFKTDDQPGLISTFKNCLKPGGTFLMEVFSEKQLANESGGPKVLDLLYQSTRVKSYFSDMQIVLMDETRIELDEGPRHRGPADVIRLVAKK